jgi:hypothetical protein
MFHEWAVLEDLSKAKQELMEGFAIIENCDCEKELKDWEIGFVESPVHGALSDILVAAENLLKARIALSDAMWNYSDVDQA